MALSENDVRGIADYARIALTDEELTEMTADVPPTFHPIGDLSNVMGADVVVPGLSIEDALLDAPSPRDRYFRVPSILGGEE